MVYDSRLSIDCTYDIYDLRQGAAHSLKAYRGEIYLIFPLLYFFRVVLGIVCLSLVVGCAGNLYLYNRATINENRKVLIDKVPFIKQNPDYCGPASLAMIFNFWGMHISQKEIAQEIYFPELKGTLSIELVLYAIKRDFEAEMYRGNLQDLREKIMTGFPLIVSHRTKKENNRVHYLVAWGFDDNKEIVYVHSGTKRNLRIDYQTFLKRWDWADNLTFFVHPKNKNAPSNS